MSTAKNFGKNTFCNYEKNVHKNISSLKLIFPPRDIHGNLPGGNGFCDLHLNQNTPENFFDVGDCCLEDLKCGHNFYNFSGQWSTPEYHCPENTCIKSNIFCIPEEIGDGICQDHNNGPFCDYDLGDCCLGPTNTTECCDCHCKYGSLYYNENYFSGK